MKAIIKKTAWNYKVVAVFGSGGYGETDYRPGYYECKKQAIKALEYYGRGFIEASRHIFYGVASSRREHKKVYELN